MKSNLGIKIDLQELDDKAEYNGGKYFIAPVFLDKEDYSRANLIAYFVKAANLLADRLGMEDIKVDKISEL